MIKINKYVMLSLSFLWISCSESDNRQMASGQSAVNSSGDAIVGGGSNNPPSRDNLGNGGAIQIVSYNEVIKPEIDQACIGCHNGANPDTALLLLNYEQVKDAISGALARLRNDDNPMPPAGAAELRARIALKLEAWQAQSFPERVAVQAALNDGEEE